MAKRVIGIVGSYRKGGNIDTLVSEVLDAASAAGAETEKIYLLDKRIEFCTNCRACTQAPCEAPGKCVSDDDMPGIVEKVIASDALVLGAPVNFSNVNALTKQFMERLVCCLYWPWDRVYPKPRMQNTSRQAVLITSSTMPTFLIGWLTCVPKALKICAQLFGAKPVAKIFAGGVSSKTDKSLLEKALNKARKAGRRIAMS